MGEAIDEGVLAREAAGLLRYASSIVRDSVLAEDLVQEALARAWERRDSFRGEATPATWLHRILHNLAVDHARRAREVPSDDVVSMAEKQWQDPDYVVDAELVAERAQTTEDLKDALLRLPFDHRAVVVLHDMEGLTVAEIARIQGVGSRRCQATVASWADDAGQRPGPRTRTTRGAQGGAAHLLGRPLLGLGLSRRCPACT